MYSRSNFNCSRRSDGTMHDAIHTCTCVGEVVSQRSTGLKNAPQVHGFQLQGAPILRLQKEDRGAGEGRGRHFGWRGGGDFVSFGGFGGFGAFGGEFGEVGRGAVGLLSDAESRRNSDLSESKAITLSCLV